MRPIGPSLAVLAALSLLTGCTATQVKDASEYVAGSLLVMALDVALDGPERRSDVRRRREDNPANQWNNPCLRACEQATELARERAIDDAERRKRRAESEAFQADFDEFMQALEEAEEHTGDPPSLIMSRE